MEGCIDNRSPVPPPWRLPAAKAGEPKAPAKSPAAPKAGEPKAPAKAATDGGVPKAAVPKDGGGGATVAAGAPPVP